MKKLNVWDNPYFLMSILLVLWGSFSAVSKLVLGTIDSFQMSFYLFGSAAAIMTVIFVAGGKINAFRKYTMKEVVVSMVYAIPSFLYYFFYALALKLIPAIEASMLNYLFPIMIVIFAVPINREKLDVLKVASVLVCFVGALVIITNGSFSGINFSNLAGDMLAFAAAVLWGVFSNLGKRNKMDNFISSYIYTVVSFGLALIGMLLFSEFTMPGVASLAGILWLSLSNIVLSYYLWFRLLKSASSALAASLSFLTPFVTLFFIMLLLGEKMKAAHLAGLAIILTGLAMQQIKAWLPSAGKSVMTDSSKKV